MICSWLILAAATLAYHGELHDGFGRPKTSKSLFPVEFRLYDAATGGTLVWGRSNPVQLDAAGNFYTELSDTRGDPIQDKSAYATLDEALARQALKGLWVEIKPEGSRALTPRTRLVRALAAHRALETQAADVIAATNARLTVAEATVGDLKADLLTAGRLRLTDCSLAPVQRFAATSAQSVTVSGGLNGVHGTSGSAESVSLSDSLRLYELRDGGQVRYVTIPVPSGAALPSHSTDRSHVGGYFFGKE